MNYNFVYLCINLYSFQFLFNFMFFKTYSNLFAYSKLLTRNLYNKSDFKPIFKRVVLLTVPTYFLYRNIFASYAKKPLE